MHLTYFEINETKKSIISKSRARPNIADPAKYPVDYKFSFNPRQTTRVIASEITIKKQRNIKMSTLF